MYFLLDIGPSIYVVCRVLQISFSAPRFSFVGIGNLFIIVFVFSTHTAQAVMKGYCCHTVTRTVII
jgi:hypothetical protein